MRSFLNSLGAASAGGSAAAGACDGPAPEDRGGCRGEGIKPVHACKVVGDLDYPMGPAAKVSTEQPCTNRPVKCATCKTTHVWSYSLRLHYETRHPGVTIPPEMQAAMKIGTHEEEWMKLKMNNRTPKACKIKDCPCGGKGL